MRAITIIPDQPDSLAVVDMSEPEPGDDDLLVDGLALGVCGTDREIVSADYGWSPANRERLIIGHESLGRVLKAPKRSEFAPGDLVVGVVRRPDPEPCGACAHDQFDMCRNGKYTERGIKEVDGYGSQQWLVDPDYAVRLGPHLEEVGVLLEPTSIVDKAWGQVEKIGARSWFAPHVILVTGAGTIGLLTALLGKQRGLDVHVYDRNESGLKPQLVSDLGATYHSSDLTEVIRKIQPDVIFEATGAPAAIFEAMPNVKPYGITCLIGMSVEGHNYEVDIGSLNKNMVLQNNVIFGTVNANLDHYRSGVDALEEADADWLKRLITRRVPLEEAAKALEHHRGDIKTVIDL